MTERWAAAIDVHPTPADTVRRLMAAISAAALLGCTGGGAYVLCVNRSGVITAVLQAIE